MADSESIPEGNRFRQENFSMRTSQEQQHTLSIATPTVINSVSINSSDTSYLHASNSNYRTESTDDCSTPKVDNLLQDSYTQKPGLQTASHSGLQDFRDQLMPSYDPSSTNELTIQSDASYPVETQEQQDDDKTKATKKRIKAKKSAKLDPKSKLEKSRQSARECRARKKLRYQYLEDLVCNREKAVMKLRKELSTFCELSKKMDLGPLSKEDRESLIDHAADGAD